MAQLKAGSTVGGVAMLLALKPSNLVEGAGTVNQFLGVDANNNVQFLTVFQSRMQGTLKAYSSGGSNNTPSALSTIDSFPFTAPFTTATNIGSLSSARTGVAGSSSLTSGWGIGGITPGSPEVTTIDYFPFSAPFTTATSAGNLNVGRARLASTASNLTAFVTGGQSPPFNSFESFPFSAPFTTATSLGNLFPSRSASMGQSSIQTGYISGGFTSPSSTYVATIDSFPFTAPFTGTTSVGSLSQARTTGASQSSTSSGYSSGGTTNPAAVTTSSNRIDSFPFSAPFTTATNNGSLSVARWIVSGQQY